MRDLAADARPDQGRRGATVPAVPRAASSPWRCCAQPAVAACCSRRSPSCSSRPRGAGAGTIAHLIWRPLTATLLWNTVRLTVVVTALCAVIGTAALGSSSGPTCPGARIWAVLVVVPFAIPDFVVSFGWASLSHAGCRASRGAVLVMTLAVYPLVYLPVAASLRGADPGQEEIARSLGASRLTIFLRVTLGQARGAILGGCLLVALVILAEYGAFEILGYQTFTTEIFTEFQLSFNIPSACALSLVLVLLSLRRARRRGARRARPGRSPADRPGWPSVPAAPPPRPGDASRPARDARARRRSPSACRSARASTGSSRAAHPL